MGKDGTTLPFIIRVVLVLQARLHSMQLNTLLGGTSSSGLVSSPVFQTSPQPESAFSGVQIPGVKWQRHPGQIGHTDFEHRLRNNSKANPAAAMPGFWRFMSFATLPFPHHVFSGTERQKSVVTPAISLHFCL